MAESSDIVAPESSFCSGRRNDVGAADGRIAEKGFVRERNRVSKTLGNDGGWKMNILSVSCEAAPLKVHWRV